MENNDETRMSQWTRDRMQALDQDLDEDWRPDVARGLALLRERQKAKPKDVHRLALAAAVAVVIAVSLWMSRPQRELANKPGPSVIYIRPEDRKMAPDFTLNDASGQPVTLSSMRGKVVVLNFWAAWCRPCQAEIGWLVEFQKTHKSAGFEVVGVSLDSKVQIHREVNYSMLTGNEEVAGLYGGVNSLPATLVIDRSGRIAAIQAGVVKRNDINIVLSEVVSPEPRLER